MTEPHTFTRSEQFTPAKWSAHVLVALVDAITDDCVVIGMVVGAIVGAIVVGAMVADAMVSAAMVAGGVLARSTTMPTVCVLMELAHFMQSSGQTTFIKEEVQRPSRTPQSTLARSLQSKVG